MRNAWVVGVVGLAVAWSVGAEEEIPRHWRRDRQVDIEHARIELSIDIPKESISGSTTLTVRGLLDDTREVELDAVGFDLGDVTVDGAAAKHDYDGETLTVQFDPPLAEGKERAIRIAYSARPKNGLYFIHGAGTHRDLDQCWSQGETEENRHWFPIHDAPDERITSETIITVPEPLDVVSNGTFVGVTPAGPGLRTFDYRMDFPHVPYLVSIAVGAWDTQHAEWNGVELSYQAPRGRAADMDRTFADTPRILEALSNEIGVKYPYPVYRQTAVSEFTFGGMENITATTLTDETLHDARAQSDWKSDGLIAHEAAHQWFGDAVTCRYWSDIWLNEGFATYYGALAQRAVLGEEQFVVEMDGLRKSAISADSGDNRRPIVTNAWRHQMDVFDGHAYAKGGMVLHALRRELGDEPYRKAVAEWVRRYSGRSAGTAEFEAIIEEVTGKSAHRFFDQWIRGAGEPHLEVSWTWRDGDCAITVKQAQERAGLVGLFDVPLDLEVLGEQADGHVLAQDVAERLDEEQETFHVAAAERPKAVLVDPKGFLLRTLTIDRKEEESAWVLAHAPDLLARFEAARQLADAAGKPKASEALIVATRDPTWWSLRREACTALEHAGSPETTGALLAVLHDDADSRVRSAAADALWAHRGADVARALEQALGADDSYAVRAAAARALGKGHEVGVERALEAALDQPSYREEVYSAALDGLAERRSPRTRALAIRGVDPANALWRRRRAMAVLGRLAREAEDRATRDALREEITTALDDPHFRVRIAAIDALVAARDAAGLADLRRVAASSSHDLTQRRAETAVRDLTKASSEQATLAEVRKALEDERKEREKLEGRIREIEARLPPEGGDEKPAK